MRRTRALREIAQRSYWREDDARRVVAAWRQSSEPASLFAGRLGIDPRRVSRWALRLEGPEDAPVHFHPVRVTDGEVAGCGTACLEIAMGDGRSIRVAPGFAAEDLRRVLAVLRESTPC